MRQGTLLLALLFASACKIDLDHAPDAGNGKCQMSTTASCVDAAGHQELSWIQDNVFSKQCANFSGCHDGQNTKQGKVDLRSGHSFATLVNADSALVSGAKLVVPSDPDHSYLEVMLGSVKGTIDPTVGLMPQNTGGQLICCQKLDAIQRWITAGAANN